MFSVARKVVVSSSKYIFDPTRLISIRFRSNKRILFKPEVRTTENKFGIKDLTDEEMDEKTINAQVDKINEMMKNLDISITPEQRVNVEKIKKKIRGGAKTERSIYREPPRPDEIQSTGNFMTKMSENPEALIDFALSHIPIRDGKRGTNQKRRMKHRMDLKRAQHARLLRERHAAHYKKAAKGKRQRELIQMYKKMAANIQLQKTTGHQPVADQKAAAGTK